MKRISPHPIGLLLALSLLLTITGCQSGKKTEAKIEGKFPNDWFYQQRAYPYNNLRSDLYYKAMEQTLAMEKNGLKSGQESWTLVGPVNVGGRITDVEMPTNDQRTIYVATASGGIFKSVNLGTTWVPIFDDAVALSLGDLDIAKTNNELIWAGTGEPNAGGGSHTYEGNGVYKSANAGSTWVHCGLASVGSIGRVKIDPYHADTVYVAAMGHLFSDNSDRGVYRTRDGGNTWQKVLYLTDSTGSSDLCINQSDPNIIYAAMWERTRRPPYQSYGGKTSGLWRSSDGGDNWTELLNGLPKGDVGRIGIDISDSDPSILYATYTDSTGYLKGIYKTIDGGDHWTATATLDSETASYWWWFSELDIDPNYPNVVYVSGLNANRTIDGGATWTTTFSSAHMDMHGVFIHPLDSYLVLLCSDGGLYISTEAGYAPFHIENLPITQFYSCEVDYMNPERHYGGTQDNGTIRTFGSTNRWKEIYGGDGFVVKVDPTNNNYVYAQYQYGGLGRSIDGGESFGEPVIGISGGDRKNWRSPLELDPRNPETLYFGTNRLYKSVNRGLNWRPVSNDLTKGRGVNVTYGTITTISVSPIDSNIIYAGTDDGNVWNTLNGGTTWTKISANLPDRWITCVRTSSFDKAVAFVTISGFRWDNYLPHVYRTSDNGQTWDDVSGNLPDFPVNTIVLDPVMKNWWYIATDGGVFITQNAGATWEIYGSSLPRVPVNDLCLHAPTRMLSAATFGRSMYTIPLPAAQGTHEVILAAPDFKAYPNPFNDVIKLTFSTDKQQTGELAAFDLSGKKIRILHQGNFPLGENEFNWLGDNENGTPAAPGIYLIRLVMNQSVSSIRVQKI